MDLGGLFIAAGTFLAGPVSCVESSTTYWRKVFACDSACSSQLAQTPEGGEGGHRKDEKKCDDYTAQPVRGTVILGSIVDVEQLGQKDGFFWSMI